LRRAVPDARASGTVFMMAGVSGGGSCGAAGVGFSAGVVESLGDLTTSAGLYASGLTQGRSGSSGFFRLGDTGTTVGTVGSQLATYNAKTATRLNKDAADDFLMKLTTAPTTPQTTSGKTFYGWVDFAPAVQRDNQ